MANYLSNNWNDVTMIKLDPGSGGGPYMVVQDAVDSNDSTQKPRMWLLRADGKWIDIVTQFALEEAERVPVWFESVAAVTQLLGGLPAKPVVFEKDIAPEKREQALKGIEQLNLEVVRQRVKHWKQEHATR